MGSLHKIVFGPAAPNSPAASCPTPAVRERPQDTSVPSPMAVGRNRSIRPVVFLLRKHRNLIDLSSPQNPIIDIYVIILLHVLAIMAD